MDQMHKVLICALATLACGCWNAPAEEAGPEAAQIEQRPVSSQLEEGARSITKSSIIGLVDLGDDENPKCKIEFAYSGSERESLIWDRESCVNLNVTLVEEETLRGLGKWERLDAFAKSHIRTLPQGKVLLVEGEFSASIFPVGTTGASYEIVVAD